MRRFLCLVAMGSLAVPAIAAPVAKRPAKPVRVAYPPTSDYRVRTMVGWTVRVHKELLTTDKALGEKALRLLAFKLDRIVQMVPPPAVAKLRQIPIWLSAYDRQKRHSCACYHPSARWLRENGYNVDKAKSVDLANARTFVSWTRQQPNMVLHELAHGYHDRFLPGGHGHAGIRAAYEKAIKAGTYESVLHINGRTQRAYAMNNPQEYFAEATEAMYGTNDFFPFVRIELKEHDPGLFALLRTLWREPGKAARKPPKPNEPRSRPAAKVAAASSPAAPGPGARPASRPAADTPRFTPTDRYVVRDIEGWKVYFHGELVHRHAELDRQVQVVLAGRLHEVTRMVPPAALAKLRTVKIWMEYRHWRSRSGAYHPSRGWLVKNGYNPDKTDSIEFARAERFLRVVRVQPSVVLHELAHAYHDQFLPDGFANKPLRAAYERAKAAKDYDACLLYTGRRLRAYAMTNPMEYFAELSEAYFGTNDFYPFVVAELKTHDPKAYALLRKLWSRP